MLYETRFVQALVITSVVEVPVVYGLFHYAFKSKTKYIKLIFTSLCASILTLPYLWFVFPPYINAHYYIIISEILITLFEAVFYYILIQNKLWQSLLVSIIANFLSYFIGYYVLH